MEDKFILMLLLLLFSFSTPLQSSPWNVSDQHSLLGFKAAITFDPIHSLANWNANLSFCQWTGVTCSPRLHRVVELKLPFKGLEGTISPLVGNLSALQRLDLSNNALHGSIPPTISGCSSLVRLALFSNRLEGSIPAELGLLSHLDTLELKVNMLTGTIPSSLGNLSVVNQIDLSNNNLGGPIPAEVGMLTQLRNLELSANHLSGILPSSLGMLTNLQSLSLWGNEFGGNIPKSLGNCSNLKLLSLMTNRLTGMVPVELGKLSLLERICVGSNRLVSGSNNQLTFFTAFTNCSHLELLNVSHNHLTGVLPPSIGHLSSKLSTLELEYNKIMGNIPQGIANLTSLTYLNLKHNRLSGYIPSGIKRLSKLERLDLSNNMLEGSLPQQIDQMQSLGLLDVSWNMLSGRIPDSLGRLQQLRRLFLHHNLFSGKIPAGLQGCPNLELVDFSHNKLTGSIPREVMASLGNLQFYLNLSGNFLQGPLPREMSKIVNVQAIDISRNRLDGVIPEALANCIALQYLSLSHNAIEGPIPNALSKLKNLQYIDLSSNSLSGAIPMSLGKIKVLQYLNVSFNNLTGQIPEGGLFPNTTINALLMGNPSLCGPRKYLLPACQKKGHQKHSSLLKVISLAAGITACVLCSLIMGILWRQRFSRQKFQLPNILFERVGYPKFTYQDIVIATNGFHETNLLGVGNFGSVYKGILRDGRVVAIKVLNLQNKEVQKSFKTECKILGRIRHRNLIQVISVCAYHDFKCLVLQFASKESLEKHLYPESNKEDVYGMRLEECLSIAIDVAHGMEYLHYDCYLQVVHCDLKPSNILLDADMTALVTDFGISKLTTATCSMDSSSTTFSLRGSIGYIAPEYGLGGGVSVKGDVYSYGILLLEMVTRKRPTDTMFVGDLNLQNWVKSAFPHRLVDVVDSKLLSNVNMEQNKCLVSFIHIALLCTNGSPQERPTMRDVRRALETLKTTFMGGARTTSNLTTALSDLICNINNNATMDELYGSQSSTY